MRQVKRVDYNQVYLLPPSIEEWIGEDHPARFIREFTEQEKVEEMEFESKLSEEGGVCYDPVVLLRVFLYGYLKKVRSFRKLEQACREDIGFIWLVGNEGPDHNTLWRFYQEQKKFIGKIFKRTVRLAVEMELVGMVLQAVDGTKIQGACSGRKGYDRAYLEKLLEALDESVQQQEQVLEGSQKTEDVSGGMKLPEDLKGREILREKVKAALKEMNDKELKHVHPQDIDARRMECDGNNRFSYNAQIVVDEKNQLIVAQEVTNQAHEQGLITPMIQKATENTGAKVQTLADGGYASSQDFAKAKEAGFDMITPLPSSWRYHIHDYHASKFNYDSEGDVVICPQGKELKFQRTRLKEGHWVKVYRNPSVCKNCPVQNLCTKNPR